MKQIKVGDRVIVPFEATQPWEEWEKEGQIVVLAPPYCIAVVEVDDYHTERVTCPIARVRPIKQP